MAGVTLAVQDVGWLRRQPGSPLLMAASCFWPTSADLFPNIGGSTDSEVLFHLALTFGMADDPIRGLARMAGFVESVAEAAAVTQPALQMTVGVTDGVRLYAARYASGSEVNTLYVSEDTTSLRMLYPANERLSHFSDGAWAVVSEPLADLPGLWREVPAGTALVIGDDIEELSFAPISPSIITP